jgi:ABC-type multidrug transport system ATPase subunit
MVVDHLSFDMYENQIFALLGHNGAGKVSLERREKERKSTETRL